ncbi:MAG: sel1 repeat family protein [Solobacterium sp.]|nr:sel1 repeat family protein [Solobacterium sp.]
MKTVIHERYTVETVVEELKKLTQEDIPQEYRNWAYAGILFADKYADADIQDFPNNIFGYIKKASMPGNVRDLVEGILNQGIEDGIGTAAFNLAELYYTGQIGEQSYEKAAEFYEMAAGSDDEGAVEKMGFCYYYGRHCGTDYKKAFELFSKGAFTGRVASLYKIGDMYKNGYYVKENKTEAFRIYSRCIDMINHNMDEAENYEADVYVRYADCYLNGTGCETDVMKALYWAQRAEYCFRKRERNSDPYAKHGTGWAMNLITSCRQILDAENETARCS